MLTEYRLRKLGRELDKGEAKVLQIVNAQETFGRARLRYFEVQDKQGTVYYVPTWQRPSFMIFCDGVKEDACI